MKTRFIIFGIGLLALAISVQTKAQEVDEGNEVTNERLQELLKTYDSTVEDLYWLPNDVIVKKGGKMGVVDRDNDLFIPLRYDSIALEADHYEVWINGKEGILDRNGRMILPTDFDRIVAVENKGQVYYIVGQANGVITNEDDEEVPDIQDALLDSLGKVIIPFNNLNLYVIESVDEETDDTGCIIAALDNEKELFGLYDFNGNMTIPFTYEKVSSMHYRQHLLVVKDEKVGLIDSNGNVLMPLNYDDGAAAMGCKMFPLGKLDDDGNVLFGFWDYDGNKLTDEVFTDATPGWLRRGYFVTIGEEEVFVREFSEGLAPYSVTTEDGLFYGVLDSHGKKITQPIYEGVYPFSSGLAAVAVTHGENTLYGYLDKNGRMAIPDKYSDANSFVGDMAVVKIELVGPPHSKTLVIDRQGKTIKAFDEEGSISIVNDDASNKALIKHEYEEYDEPTIAKYYDNKGNLVKIVRDDYVIDPQKF